MVCISGSFYLACKFIQASKSTSSYSEHTTYSELLDNRSLLWLLLNRSVKCITMLTTVDTIKLMSLFPNSNISKQFPTYAQPIAPFNSRSLHPCTGLNNHRPGYLSPPPGTYNLFDVLTWSVCVHRESPARCIYNYNLYPWVFTNYLKLPITQI